MIFSKEQVTLGKMIEDLKSLPKGAMVDLEEPHSYRGQYSEIAFTQLNWPTKDAHELAAEIETLISEDRVFYGYKGGKYTYDKNTPVWAVPTKYDYDWGNEYSLCGFVKCDPDLYNAVTQENAKKLDVSIDM
jgi:hypothetical protein